MAGGKLSARQKMINLMYLIFIAMLALNMSKEVLSAFGLMNEKLTESNQAATARNEAFMAGLADKAEEQPAKYQPIKQNADQVTKLANDFNAYLADLKGQMTAKVEDPKDYEVMDKGDFLDNNFFKGDKLKPEGQEFLDQMAKFRDGVVAIIGDSYPTIANDVKAKFATEPVKNRDGNTIDWLDYHYKGFPLVASLTKMTQLQADIKSTESEVLSAMLAGEQVKQLSMRNYQAIVIPEKTAFFSGENFKGKVVLGRFDNTMNFDKIVVNGREIENTQAGQVVLDFPAGAVGEREINGTLQFKEGDSIVPIEIKSTYAVVPKPNSATISADKMNVVYRGVENPMTISFAGVSDNNVSASAPGLSKASGVGKYVMRPGGGKEVVINVTGKLPDGTNVSDRATFRIKDIPKPSGSIARQQDNVSLPRANVEIATVEAVLNDFDFELPIRVTSFKVKVPGQPSVNVNGNKMNDQAKNALRKASRGDGVQIFDIKAEIVGNSAYKLPTVSPVFVEITN